MGVATIDALDDDGWAAMGKLLSVSNMDREKVGQMLRLRAVVSRGVVAIPLCAVDLIK